MLSAKTYFIFLIFCLLLHCTKSQSEYNLFKSYKDADIKPHHYGKNLRRQHPIEEYLTGNQIRMMKHRKSKSIHSDAKFKSNWSGIQNKDNRKLNELVNDVKELTMMKNNLSSYSIRCMWLFIIFCSIGWLCYILYNRNHNLRNKLLLPTKTSINNDLENLSNETNIK